MAGADTANLALIILTALCLRGLAMFGDMDGCWHRFLTERTNGYLSLAREIATLCRTLRIALPFWCNGTGKMFPVDSRTSEFY